MINKYKCLVIITAVMLVANMQGGSRMNGQKMGTEVKSYICQQEDCYTRNGK